MSSWKRRLVDSVADRFGVHVSRKGAAWELIEPEFLSRFLKAFQVDCVFDVGANYGQYAARLRAIGFRGLIISFEPNPDAAARLREMAANAKDWIIKEIALDSESREMNFNVMKRSTFSSLHEPDHSGTGIFVEMNAVERQVRVQTQTLGKEFPKLQSEFEFARPYLKLDTQGHDLAVVRGAGDHIRRFVGLQSELSFTSLYKDSPDAETVLQSYRNLGFKLSSLVPNNASHFPDLHEIDCVMYNPAFVESGGVSGAPGSEHQLPKSA